MDDGSVTELGRRQRTEENVLAILRKDPLISTWDMSENIWLRDIIGNLCKRGLIKKVAEPYPWYRYEMVEND